MRLQKSLAVITATAYLHNFAVSNGDFYEDDIPEEDQDQPQQHSKVLKTPLLLEVLQGNKLFGIFFNIEKATLDLTR